MKPTIGNWYQEGRGKFEVILFNEDDGSIEIKDSDGTVDKMCIDEWDELAENGDIELIDEPVFDEEEDEEEEE